MVLAGGEDLDLDLFWLVMGVIFEKCEAGILGGLMCDDVIVVQEILLWEYEM